MISKFVNPKICSKTSLEWRVPDISTKALFCSISSVIFCARLIETNVNIIGLSCCFVMLSNDSCFVVSCCCNER